MTVDQKYKDQINEYINSNAVFVASKSYCPYCKATKELLRQLGIKAKIIELDQTTDGNYLQQALLEISGQRTVPNIFIGGKHIGGNSDLQSLNSQGKLEGILKDAGAL